MNINELYLKTAFSCMACDGDIDPQEVELVKLYVHDADFFKNLDAEKLLNEYIADINDRGRAFLHDYLHELKNAQLDQEQEMNVVKIAIQMIEADNIIKYSEVSFFKKIRKRLHVTDEVILKDHPDKDYFLEPDIEVPDEMEWNFKFDNISLQLNNEIQQNITSSAN